MSGFLEMDIFFFVTTLVVVATGILLVAILLRIWRILGHIEEISKDVSAESVLLRDDIADLRTRIRHEGFKIRFLSTFFSHALKRFTGKPRRATRREEQDD